MIADTTNYVEECPFCSDKRFIHRKALEEHWIHSKRHGWCQSCQRLFTSQHGLAIHLRTAHQRETRSIADAYQRQTQQEGAGTTDGPSRLDNHVVQYTASNSNPALNSNVPSKPAQNVICFGCDRCFKSYASMMLHLEEGECITTATELGQIAENASQSDLYVTYGLRRYLREQYGKEKLAFDTDHSSVWECCECRQVFHSLNHANTHAKSPAHRPKVFKCPGCPTFFAALSGLLQHVEQSDSCSEGLYKGTGAMGKLLSNLEERLRYKDNGDPKN